MEHHTTTSRAEAERLLGIAEKLLSTKDFSGSRDFAILAQETEPLLDGSDQILAVAEVHLSADAKLSNNQYDWYTLLQLPSRENDSEIIKKQYRRLALLLHPDKNKYAFADSAFRLVSEAWGVLSDVNRKANYDAQLVSNPRFAKVDLGKKVGKRAGGGDWGQKLPVRRSGGGKKNANNNTAAPVHRGNGNVNLGDFWTACPYCHILYEYPRVYEGCCLRCDNEKCKRAFTAAEILSMPPLVPGREAYYCCWGVFPMGFVEKGASGDGFKNWMPNVFGEKEHAGVVAEEIGTQAQTQTTQETVGMGMGTGTVPPVVQPVQVVTPVQGSGPKKRGRPRKIM